MESCSSPAELKPVTIADVIVPVPRNPSFMFACPAQVFQVLHSHPLHLHVRKQLKTRQMMEPKKELDRG